MFQLINTKILLAIMASILGIWAAIDTYEAHRQADAARRVVHQLDEQVKILRTMKDIADRTQRAQAQESPIGSQKLP